MGHKFCKFRENCARDDPMWSVYIPKFGHILVKVFSFGGSYTLIVAPIGVKFGKED